MERLQIACHFERLGVYFCNYIPWIVKGLFQLHDPHCHSLSLSQIRTIQDRNWNRNWAGVLLIGLLRLLIPMILCLGVGVTPPTVETNLQEAFPLMRAPLPSDFILYQVVKLICTRENLISFIEYISVVCKLLWDICCLQRGNVSDECGSNSWGKKSNLSESLSTH